MHTASFRLPPELIGALARTASRRGEPRSEVVRAALEEYLARAREEGNTSLGALVDALVTYPGSGVGDLAARSEAHLRSKFHARRRRPR
jgi:metal-responsive CopG/Arc/MetJ family transcriptional regulator